MAAAPAFTVVMATWNRGAHILPSIRSVLAQEFQDFELIIVGDGCTDDTAAVVAPFLSERVRWLNLPERCGSQSFANNAGIATGRGRAIAYLGHDDIWAPGHLGALARVLATDPGAGFAIAGAALHGPEGSGVVAITGLFEDDEAPFTQFFPPSSVAHRRAVVDAIGPWRAPAELRLPVDCDFQLRAARAGIRFRPTGAVSVHKFTSTHRYLSYLLPSSVEQEAMLERLRGPGMEAFVAEAIAAARACGRYMTAWMPDPATRAPGEEAARNHRIRGLLGPAATPLADPVLIAQDDGPRGLDWHPPFEAQDRRFRWSGPNPRPRVLLPFTADGRVEIAMEYREGLPDYLRTLRIMLNGEALAWRPVTAADGRRWLFANARLRAEGPSVLEFVGRSEALARIDDGQRRGFAMGELMLRPIGPG